MPDLIELIATGVEQAISLSEAAKLPAMQRNGRPAHLSKMYRAIHEENPLEHARHGGVVVTTREACERFLRRRTFGENAKMPVHLSPRRKQNETAKRELATAGYRRKAS